MALGLFAVAGVALIGLIGVGLKVTGEVKSDYGDVLLAENLRSQYLVNAAWPGKSSITYCDETGSEVAEKDASYVLEWKKDKHEGWDSDYFDVRSVAVRRVGATDPEQTLLLGRALAEPEKP